MAISLCSSGVHVETPFIIATIGDYAFGVFDRKSRSIVDESGYARKVTTLYPNFTESITVTKLNGEVNTYTLVLKYAIKPGDDPNLIDRILGTVSQTRKIVLSYGDYSSPTFIYKEETATITEVTQDFDFRSSCITYNINCVSDSVALTAGTYFFGKRIAKPSEVIEEILYDTRYGLLDVYYGMRDHELVKQKGLIASDDKQVVIEAQSNISVLDYLKYLISCMTSQSSVGNSELIQGNKYIMTMYDDFTGIFGGPYFKIQRVARNIQETNSVDIYTVDVGFPVNSNVVSFAIDNNQTYSILYDYSQKIGQSEYNYRINDKGKMDIIYSPTLSRTSEFYKTTEADKTWWTKMTQYPITAKLTIKGLLKPAILMTYLKVNVFFYGRKHISSGTYIITSQTDTVGIGGYRTQLSLTRIAGDEG